ncbi:type II toxin-antitoxin system VapB family antitoxin [Rhizohabitans arisaemae]|uniref:type II toxin-antitoxin system VapB family antitoxin n=1 Tax=Rhizohabitans arisaemae TaxID=2720610 RepID=UPI0024B216DE|nr:type II toxin-antitoxin system VapB family antitoxin [Rhizohabitans arisaemae]
MAKTQIDLDDEALALAAEELGTTSKVATVNAALREIAYRRAGKKFMALLDEIDIDLTEDAYERGSEE